MGGRREDVLAFLDNEVLVDVSDHDKEQGRKSRVEGGDKFRVDSEEPVGHWSGANQGNHQT